MAYVGNVPARSFISFERQVFTIVNSQTAYTLSHSVTNENDIRLVVNNVVQEPGSGKAYTATGTTLTLSAALTNGTDEMYCVFLGRAVGTVNAPAGSVGTSQLAADAVTNAKIADDAISDEQLDPTVITGQTAETSIATDDLILLSDTSASGALKKMTRANFVSGVGGVNSPRILTCMNNYHTITANTATKVPFNRVDINTGGTWDSSNYRWTPGTAGTYVISFQVFGDSGAADNLRIIEGTIKISGTAAMTAFIDFRDSNARSSTISNSIITELTDSNYIELFATIYDTSGNPDLGGGSSGGERFKTYISSYKILT